MFRKARCVTSMFFNENNVVMLQSQENDLNDSDKIGIMKSNNIDAKFMSPAISTSVSKMFPLLCKMFSMEGKLKSYGSSFFQGPVPCLLKEFDEMKRQNKIHYAALILCLMNENKISQNILDNAKDKKDNTTFLKIKYEVLQKCKICSQTDNFEFLDALSEMEGTYTKLCGTEFTFVHDSMFEVIAYHFGNQFPELIIQYMSSNYIANFIKPSKCEVHNSENESESKVSGFGGSCEVTDEGGMLFGLTIRICDNQYPLLAKRLYRDIEAKKLYDVFGSDILKHPELCKSFIDLLKRKRYRKLRSLFLSGQIKVCKSIFGEISGEDTEIRKLLVDERQEPFSAPTIRVRVISWIIYYGHNQILQYLVEQCARHNKTCDLFENCYEGYRSHSIMSHGWHFHIQAESKMIIEQTRLLVLSCYSGDIETVKILLKNVNKTSINRTPEYSGDVSFWRSVRKTPLIAACEVGNMSIVRELLKEGAIVNQQGNNCTPLTVSCAAGHMDVVKVLLKKGASVNPNGGFDTPLITACTYGHGNVVRKLLKRGADVNQQGKYDTPMIAACWCGHTDVMRHLLKAGANINLKGMLNSPLTVACTSGHVTVVKELIKLAADINIQDRDRETPLTVAYEEGYTGIVEELLNAGADVKSENQDGYTLMHLVALSFSKTDSKIQQKLFEFGADFTKYNSYGVSPLYAALIQNNKKFVKQFISQTSTPMLNSAKIHLFNILIDLKHGSVGTNSKGDVMVTDRRVWSMDRRHNLWKSIRYSNSDSLRHLLCLGLSVNQHFQLHGIRGREHDKSNVKPLLFAVIDELPVEMGDKVMVLLQAGADVNVRIKYEHKETELDKAGVSVLERTRQWVSHNSKPENRWKQYHIWNYKAALTVLKKHLRRYSV